MKTVEVKTGKPYRILIERGLLQRTGALAREVSGAGKAAILTDDIVDALYADTVAQSLSEAGFMVSKFVFPNGEGSKHAGTWIEMVNFLAEQKLTRSDLVVALGGGVVGDLAGFAAASYLRGISFIQIPTTLLACVDSSVGGKTGFDLPSGKNLCGAFWQPSLVICDYDALSTLPPETFADGVAEALKCGVLSSEELFARFETETVREQLPEIIAACVSYKRDLVTEDEFDTGKRQFLNLGHTFGHAIEKQSGFTVTHGHAVAIGTVIAANIAVSLGLCTAETAERIRAALLLQKLPVSTQYDAETLSAIALSDKKRRGNEITLVLPERIGSCVLHTVSVEALPKLLSAGLSGIQGERQDG